jgi:hypothetical protein
MATLLRKNVVTCEEVNTGWSNLTESSKEGCGSKRPVLPVMLLLLMVIENL